MKTLITTFGLAPETTYSEGVVPVTDNGSLISLSDNVLTAASLPIPIIDTTEEYLTINSREATPRILDISFNGTETYTIVDSSIFDFMFSRADIQATNEYNGVTNTYTAKEYTALGITDTIKSFIAYYKIANLLDYDMQYITKGCILNSIGLIYVFDNGFIPQVTISFNGLSIKQIPNTIDYEPQPLRQSSNLPSSLTYLDWNYTADSPIDMTELIRSIALELNISNQAQAKGFNDVTTAKIYAGNYSYSISLGLLRNAESPLYEYCINFNKETIPITVSFQVQQGEYFYRYVLYDLVPLSVQLSNDEQASQIDIFGFKFNSFELIVYDGVSSLTRSV